MKGQKGITLVALIITIIVMLILVAVTISVALNGGLFTKAKDARDKTVEEQLKEAATVTKAELLTEYYADDKTTLPTEAHVTEILSKYLGDTWTINSITESGKVYTIKATTNEKQATATMSFAEMTFSTNS